MPKTVIALPCKACKLETALHAICDHHDAWNADVRVVLYKPQNFYTLEIEIESGATSERGLDT